VWFAARTVTLADEVQDNPKLPIVHESAVSAPWPRAMKRGRNCC